MICKNCGGELPEGVRFCIHCGTPVEAGTVPAAPAPKKKKNGLIVAVALLLVLVIGGGAGVYLYSQHRANVAAYDEAVMLLEDGKYEDALAAFKELGNFQDAAEKAAELEKLQEDYNAAKDLLKNHKFDEAVEAFTELGDYRDSAIFVSSEITYQKALYMKSFADARDASGLSEAFGNDYEATGLNLGDDEAAALLYGEAFQLFDGLGQYSDSADLASECCREIAMILLNAEYFDEALLLCDKMNEADAAAVQEEYRSNCADSRFLEDIAEAFVAWYDDEGLYDFDEEIENAIAIVEPYATQHFENAELQDCLADLADALDVMKSACSEGGVDDWVTYYEGMAELYAIADKLYMEFGVFADDNDLMDAFVGYGEITATYPVIEQSLTDWYDALSSVSYDDEGNCYVPYTNDTGLAFVLIVYEQFYDADDNLIDDSGDLEVYVEPGATVHIPVEPASISDDDWSSCDIIWWFDVDLLN